ncbi:MAG: hypothetical protein AAAB35_15810 [Phyllobacterium sp.]|uniref:hypothetical protein n=1 Tax=Phyllobacterium sp. TaxID=1871046 RepID=UPI0030F0A933
MDKRQKPDDLIAIASGISIGRTYRIQGGPQHGRWYFNFQLARQPFRTSAMNGVASKRKIAQQRVPQTFVDYLETPSDLGGGKPGGCIDTDNK